MNRSQRLKEILSILSSEKSVSSSELARRFSVSEVTIRKDLNFLETSGQVHRTFGGAQAIDFSEQVEESSTSDIASFFTPTISPNAIQLAQKCLMYIEPNDNIFLGSGSTCCALSQLLPNNLNLSVVTNNLSAVPMLISKGINIFFVGGEVATLNGNTYFSSISEPEQYLKSIHLTKAFTSCYGLGIHTGVTVNSVISSYIFKVLPNLVQNWYLMASDEKFSQVGMYEICPLSAIHRIICHQLPSSVEEYCQQMNIRISRVPKVL